MLPASLVLIRLFRVATLVAGVGVFACANGHDGGPIDRHHDLTGAPTGDLMWASSPWRGVAQLEEDLRIGELDGPDEYTFGHVTEITPAQGGGFFVFDYNVPVLRLYDHEGQFVRNLGRVGQGPGEYAGAVLGMAVRSDGHLLAYDISNGRINIYGPDGEPSGEIRPRISNGLHIDRALLLDSLDRPLIRIMTGTEWPPPVPWPVGVVALGLAGEVRDTIWPPAIQGEPPQNPGRDDPRKIWEITPYATVVGVNDAPTFEIRPDTGGVITVSGPLEAAKGRASYEGDLVYWGFRIAEGGRVWVDVNPPAEEEGRARTDAVSVFHVFEADGNYLGEVHAPPRTELRWIGPQGAYGVQLGDFDEEYVVRLILRAPSI